MKAKNILGTLVLVSMAMVGNAQQKLMHYWHFNNFTSTASAAVDPATLVPYRADYTLFDTNLVKVSYITIPGTSAAYKTYWDVSTGDTVNVKNGVIAGNCLRLRNPSDSMQLQFRVPSTLFKNITIKYEVQKSSASNGAANNGFSYSVDSGVTWLTAGLSVPSYTVTNYSGGSPQWPLTAASVTINDPLAYNNPNLVFRIRFDGTGSTGTSGNNRLDNFSVEGDSIVYPTITSSVTNLPPFITSKNQTSASQVVHISGVNLLDSLHIQAPSYFKIALTETGTYSSKLSLVPSSGTVSQDIYIQFTPTDTGTVYELLNISSLNAIIKSVTLTGTTLPVPVITTSGSSAFVFSNTQPNQLSTFSKITVSAVNLTDTLWLQTKAPFLISLDSTVSGSAQIALTGSTITGKSIYVFFKPTAYGVYNDTLSISSTGANSFTIPLAGSSIAKPVFSISNPVIDTFANISVGSNSTAKSITVNGTYLTGAVTVSVSNPFKLSTDQVSFTNSILLTPVAGALNQVVYVYFNPTQSGAFGDNILITSLDTSNISLPVYGTTLNPFAGMKSIYEQDFTASSNAAPPAGWKMTDTSLWSIVSSNPSEKYAFASGGNCLKFDNEGSELPKTAYATLSGKLDATYYKDLKVIWAARRTNNFFNGAIDGKSFIMYSTNGTSWDTLYYITEPNNSNLWAYVNDGGVIDLPAACNHKADVQLRWLFTSEGLGTSGTYRMDDLKVFATSDTLTTGIETLEGSGSMNVTVYPNPANSIITIECNTLEMQSYTLTNILGDEIAKGTIQKTTSIDASLLKSGMYILRVGNSAQKVLVQH